MSEDKYDALQIYLLIRLNDFADKSEKGISLTA